MTDSAISDQIRALDEIYAHKDAAWRKTNDAEFAAARATMVEAAWKAGDLSHLLDLTQLAIYSAAKTAWRLSEKATRAALDAIELTLAALAKRPKRQFAARASRRLGKSTVGAVMALEIALTVPGASIAYVAKDAVDIAKVVHDIFENPETGILRTCPGYLKPDPKDQGRIYRFPNGSVIEFHGCDDNKIEDLRGRAFHFIVADEIGTWQQPEYALKSVLIPTTHTTNGRIFIPTTPAKTPGHESKAILDKLEAEGLAARFTIIDSKRLSPIEKVEALVDAGETPAHALEVVKSKGAVLPKTTTARRELFVMDVTDAGSAVLPEFQEVEAKLLVRVVEKEPIAPTPGNRYVELPDFFHGFTVLDPAPTNIIALLVGYYDFLRGVFVFQRERFLRGSETSSDALADAVEALERSVWGDDRWMGGFSQPNVRILDPDSGLEKEMKRRRLAFRHADKKNINSDGSWRSLRAMLTSGQIEIADECVELRRQMRESVKNVRNTDIAFEKDGTHGDGIKAVQYAVRTVRANQSPYPEGWRMEPWRPGREWVDGRGSREPEQSAFSPDTDFSRRQREADAPQEMDAVPLLENLF